MKLARLYLFLLTALLVTPLVSRAQQSLSSAPVHRYSFNITAGSAPDGTEIPDLTGTANGVIRGSGAIFTGTGLSLPGGSSSSAAYVDLPNGIASGSLDQTPGYANATYEFWVTVNSNLSYSRVFDFGTNDSGEVTTVSGTFTGIDYLVVSANVGTSPNIRFTRNGSGFTGGASQDIANATTIGTKVHLIVTYDAASGAWKLYKNATLIGTLSTLAGPDTIPDLNVWLGRSNYSSDSNANITYDEFRIYNYALNAQQILGNYQTGPDTVTVISIATPDNLTAIVNNQSVTLNWTAVPGAVSYNVKRSTTSGGSYTTVATGVTGTSYTDPGLANRSYFYVASAVGVDGEGANSAEAKATVGLPPQPTGLAMSAGNNKVFLNWTATTGADSYNIKRSTSPGGPYITIATGVTGTSFTDTTASNATTYYYVISGVSGSGEGVNSTEVFTTPHSPITMNKADNTANLNLVSSWLGGVVPSDGDIAQWTALAGANSVSLGANLSVQGISVANTGGTVTIGAGNTLTLGVAGIDMSAATQNLTINSKLTLGAGNQTWNVATGRTFTLTGTLARGTGAALLIDKSTSTGTVTASPTLTNGIIGPWAIVKSAGSAAINSANGYTYATVSGGSIVPYTSGSSAIFGWTSTNPNTVNYDVTGTSSQLGVNRTANTVRYVGSTATQYWGNANTTTITLNGMMNAGTGTLTFAQNGPSNTSTSFGQLVIGANSELVLAAAGANITIAIPIVDNGSTSGAVVITGPNTVTLSSASTFTGGLVLASGTLSLGNNNALGTGTMTLAGGALTSGTAVTLTNTVSVAANTLTNIRAVASDLTLSGNISGSGSLDMAGTLGASAVSLGGTNSGFTGTATISGVNIRLTSTNAGSATAAWVINSGAGLQATTNAGTYSLGSLNGSGNLGTRNVTGTATYSIGGANTNTIFAGTITNVGTVGNAGGSGIVALTKVGIGTFTLAGNNSFSGATTITSGMLLVNGALSGNGAVSVADSAALSGTGTVSGAVTVATGGSLSPGNAGAGVLTLSGALTLNDGTILNMELGSTGSSDRIVVGGALTANGVMTVNITALAGFGAGTYQLITSTGTINAANFTLGTTPAGYSCALSASNGTLSVTVIAPPTAPAGLTATGSNSAVILSWSASTGASSYNVKRSFVSGSNYSILVSGTLTNYTDPGLTNGTTYYYEVSAVNAAGESADSAQVSATPLSPLQSWRQTYFGTISSTGNAADDADPDGDGRSNLLEYATGSDPVVAQQGDAATIGATANNTKLTLKFHRITDPALTYEVLASDELSAWNVIWSSTGPQNIDGDVEVTDPDLKSAHAKRFLRLRVSQ